MTPNCVYLLKKPFLERQFAVVEKASKLVKPLGMGKVFWINSKGRKFILNHATKPMKTFQIPIPFERFNRRFFPISVWVLDNRGDGLRRNLLVTWAESAIFARRCVLRLRFRNRRRRFIVPPFSISSISMRRDRFRSFSTTFGYQRPTISERVESKIGIMPLRNRGS